MDQAVELSVIEAKSFYALMDDTSISENIFLDTEEPQVQPNTSAGTHQWLLKQCNQGLAVNQWHLSCTIKSVYLPGLTNTPHQKNISPEIDRVTSLFTPHHLKIFRDESLQFTRNAVIRANTGNRLLLDMIWVSIFLGFMTIVQLFAKVALNHLTTDKNLPPINS